jgi:Holliday junction resolvase
VSNRAHKARRDASEPEVITALVACGWQVEKLAQKGIPDLLAYKGETVKLVEVKTGAGKLRKTQNFTERGLPVVVLRTAEDVFSWHLGQKVRIAKGG